MKEQFPIRTWAQWDEARPGFVEVDCVGHERGPPSGDFCQTLTDIRTAWTKIAAVKNNHVACKQAVYRRSDTGDDFAFLIELWPLRWCG